MRLRLFRAPSMAEAMRQLRDALGPDAVILSTARRGREIEITAATASGEAPAVPLGAPPPALVPAPPAPAQRPQPPADPLARALARAGLPPSMIARLLAAAPPAGLAVPGRPADPSRRLALALAAAGPALAALPAAEEAPAMMLVGPAGAGKTLSTAKLAARAVIAGHRPLVVTADGARAGAAEQLAALRRVLGLDLVIAAEPSMLLRALAHRPPGAPLLLDTPALNPFSAADGEHLAALAAAAAAEPVLVLPAGIDAAEASDIAQSVLHLGARKLIATRLDAARRLGGVLAAAEAGLALAAAGVGEQVAEGLAAVDHAALADALLHPLPDRAPAPPPGPPPNPPALAEPLAPSAFVPPSRLPPPQRAPLPASRSLPA
ncbi:MAG: hypothetical protein IT557_13145 [Alphaproteobacteria bacterium]|nr:hypothetical protein [Alphaproteobacteria bacterium]